MTNYGLRMKATIAFFALGSGGAADASDAIYLGDCARATSILESRTVSQLVPFKTYEGVARVKGGNLTLIDNVTLKDERCGREEVYLITLSERSRSADKLTFLAKANAIEYCSNSASAASKIHYGEAAGEVTFTTQLTRVGELCEISILSNWIVNAPISVVESGFLSYSGTVNYLENGDFTVESLNMSFIKTYISPIGFTGID